MLTRRPVLIWGAAIDGLIYTPEIAPAANRVLREVYGIDLLAPPFSADEATGTLPHDTGRALWEARSVVDWQAIRSQFGTTDVVTFADWHLQLPEVGRSADLVLYCIPDGASAEGGIGGGNASC